MAATELLAPVPAAADYSVSAELWQRLEDEIQMVSRRIDNGDVINAVSICTILPPPPFCWRFDSL